MEDLKKMTDEELVVLYSKGDNQAFDILLNRYQNRLFSYIYFILKNRELTEDIFQETFVKVIMTIKQGRYTENGKFPAWISRIAHNLIIDYFRQERYENIISSDDEGTDIFNNMKLSEGSIEKEIISEQICQDIRKMVHLLPLNQREVVQMRFYQNLSFKEIADFTGVSINTALGRMRYAVLNLRRMVEEKNLVLTID